MRARFLVLCALSLCACDGADASPGHLEVHEWGTFTSMQGPDGVWLEGLHHEEEALPKFVHNMASTSERAHRRPTKGGLIVERVTRKMETPVIYFYAPRPMRVTVDVSFPAGLINQWYPAAARHSYSSWNGKRDEIERADAPIDVAKIDRSSVRWEVTLAPRGGLDVPAVAPGDPWALARRTEAAQVQTEGRESEHYLFYRGLGRESIAVHVRDLGGGALQIDNKTGHGVSSAFALEVTEAGARVAPRVAVASMQSARATLTAPLRPTRVVVAELRARIKAALIAEGLFEPEAEAMVATWSRQWFRSRGTRVIYVVPRAEIDRMLPIQISPKPRALTRAFIGRIEVITRARRHEIARALARGDDATLATLGRFEEPYLRLLAGSGASRVKALAARRLATLGGVSK